MERVVANGQRLVALFILGCLLFNYPLLSLLNFAGDAFGVPAERGLRHAQAVPGTV